MNPGLGPYIGATIVSLVILGGLYAIARNLVVFIVDLMHGHGNKAWFDRPYLFRVLAWVFTLFWLFGPYKSLHISTFQTQALSFALYVCAAAAWLWLLRIGFLDGIPQTLFNQGPAWAKHLGWHGHAAITYGIQLICAAGIGLVFVLVGSQQLAGIPARSPLVFLLVLPFLLGTAAMSLWRISSLTSQIHTLPERVAHLVGGRDAGAPHPPTE